MITFSDSDGAQIGLSFDAAGLLARSSRRSPTTPCSATCSPRPCSPTTARRPAGAASSCPARVITTRRGRDHAGPEVLKVKVNVGTPGPLARRAPSRAAGAGGGRHRGHQARRGRVPRRRRLASQPRRRVQGPRGGGRGAARRGALAGRAGQGRRDRPRQARPVRGADALPLRPLGRLCAPTSRRGSRS